MPKVEFLHSIGRSGLAVFNQDPEALERDLENARR